MVTYIPTRQDIVWLDFTPQRGKEIKKMRPALVISPFQYNKKVGLALFMPITSHVKGYPFETLINTPEISGAILCDQMRSLDWKDRRACYIAKLSHDIYQDVMDKFKMLIR